MLYRPAYLFNVGGVAERSPDTLGELILQYMRYQP